MPLIRKEEIQNFNSNVIAATLTSFISGAGVVASSDSILQAIQKLNGNDGLKATTASPTFTGTPIFTLGSDATGDIWYRNSSGFMTRLGIGSTNNVLTVVSGLPSWQTISLSNHTAGTGLSGATYNGSGAISWTVDQTFAPTWTGIHTINNNAVGATTVTRLFLTNTTAAVNGTQQYSPTLEFIGSGFATTPVTAQTMGARLGIIVTQGTTIASSTFNIDLIQGATGLYSTRYSFGSGGASVFIGGSFTNNLSFGAAVDVSGIISLNSAASTSGTPLQNTPGYAALGTVWNTTATAASNVFGWRQLGRGVSSTIPSSIWVWQAGIGVSTPSFTDVMSLTSAGMLTTGLVVTKASSLSAINSTATATAAQVATGVITSTSAALTTITLPTATLLATQLNATQGTSFDFVVDNSGGANIVTLVLGTGMTALAIITGSNTLTIAAGSTGIFRIYFKSTTTASFVRLG